MGPVLWPHGAGISCPTSSSPVVRTQSRTSAAAGNSCISEWGRSAPVLNQMADNRCWL